MKKIFYLLLSLSTTTCVPVTNTTVKVEKEKSKNNISDNVKNRLEKVYCRGDNKCL